MNRRIVHRHPVSSPAEYVGRHVPDVPHPNCTCGRCGNFAHERWHQVVEELTTASGEVGAKVFVFIAALN